MIRDQNAEKLVRSDCNACIFVWIRQILNYYCLVAKYLQVKWLEAALLIFFFLSAAFRLSGICSFLVVQVPKDTSLIRDRSMCTFNYFPCTLLNTNNFIFRQLVLDSLMTHRSKVKRVLMDRSEVSLL
jgi:hypothetical protein